MRLESWPCSLSLPSQSEAAAVIMVEEGVGGSDDCDGCPGGGCGEGDDCDGRFSSDGGGDGAL